MGRERIQLRCKYALGDIVVLTGAVRDLVRSYPGRFEVSVQTGSADVWLNNPYVRERFHAGRVIDCDGVPVDYTGKTGKHYVEACLDHLNASLGTEAVLSVTAGDIHLSAEERRWYSDVWSLCGREIPFWLICTGGKFDLPTKWWSASRYQQVVDALRGKVQFVQVGTWGNHHPPLRGVIDLRGKTSVRDLIHLVHHADGVLCGVTSLMHLAAAVPTRGKERAGIIVAGDREPRSWEAYPGHIYLTSEKELDCRHCWSHRLSEEAVVRKGYCHRGREGLAECLHEVSSERVLAAFEQLRARGQAIYLGEREYSFGRKAVKEAARRNAFDRHNVNEANAPEQAAEFLRNLAAYPQGRYDGRGIVICAGGLGYFTQAWVCVRMLRQLGCRLPVELWYFGRGELDGKMERLVARLNVRCVDAQQWMKKEPMRNPLGWELKCYAVLHSRFREVLSLDADNVPVVDPTFLFETPEFGRTGAIFWPDYHRLSRKRAIWKYCGVAYRNEPEFESGQMVIDKERCWRALNLAWWYNDHSEFFYRHIHGDKETFHLAWRRTETEYAMPPFAIESLEGVMCQHDFEGRRIFQHRNSHKWTFSGENRRIAGFIFEDDCRRHLERLREVWDGKIEGRRPSRVWLGKRLRLDTIDHDVAKGVARDNEYRLPVGFSERDVIMDVGAHIGSFARAAHERGSRAVYAFEPHAENYALLEENTGGLAGVRLYHGAVLDEAGFGEVGEFPKDIGKQNTGGAKIAKSARGVSVVGINEVLRELRYVTLLKLDCEGSEWPILQGIQEWERVGAVCGEYHPAGFDSVARLTELLRPQFRFVRIEVPNDEGLGKFWASHIRSYFCDGYRGQKRVSAGN